MAQFPGSSRSADNAAEGAKDAARDAKDTGQEVEQSQTFGALVTVGLLAYGVVHLLVAWIAVQVAWTGTGEKASQQGALQQLASGTFGDLLIWITAVGLFALTLWQVFEAIWGHRDAEEGRKRIVKRLGSAGKAVVYGALGVNAVSTAIGSSSGGNGEQTLTARLMSNTAGRYLVAVIGIAVIVTGGRLAYRGIKKKFTRDLVGGVPAGVVRLGQIGYVAKGVALAIVGVLFVVAAVTFDPKKAGGLDTALRSLRNQAYGSILLTLLALGIACFGLYCFVWSRHVKKS